MAGSPQIPQRNLSSELGDIFHGFDQSHKTYKDFWKSEPLLSQSHDFALNNLTNIGDLIQPLQQLFGSLPGQVGGLAGQVGDLGGQVGGLNDRLGNLYQNLPGTQGLTDPLQQRLGQLGQVYNAQIQPGLMSGGALNAAQNRDVSQATRAAFAAQGNAVGNQALGTELLNRDQYRRTRFNELLGQGLGISGEQRGLASGIEGINTQDLMNRLGITAGQGTLLGQQGNLIGQQAGLLGSQAGLASGLASGIQGLQQGGINQALGVEQGQIGSYASLINPLLVFGQDVGSSNQNAAAAQSIAGGNKTSGLIGSGASILGSVAAAY